MGPGEDYAQSLHDERMKESAEIAKLRLENERLRDFAVMWGAEKERLLLEAREKDSWIQALKDRVDTMTDMMAKAGLVMLSPCPTCGGARKQIACSLCAKNVQEGS